MAPSFLARLCKHACECVLALASFACAAAARADTTVWLDFPPLPAPPAVGDPPQAQRDAVKAGLMAKFAFEPNIHFTFTQPGTGSPPYFTIHFKNGTNEDYGDSSAHGYEGTVYRGDLVPPGANGHLEAGFFDTVAKQQNAMIDIAAHELGHLFGLWHNCVAPTTEDHEDDPTGHKRFWRRPHGTGADANGRTGLMADGHKVLPSEVAADMRDFTGSEKDDIIAFIAKRKGVTPTRDDPRKGNTKSSKSVKTVKGLRPIIVPMPPYPTDSPSIRFCPWIDIHVQFINNAGWEFGYVAIDGGFRRLIHAGLTEGDMALTPGETLDFAVHQPNAPASARVSFTEGSFLPQPNQPVNPANSVEPVVTQPYFRFLVLNFDTDNNPATQPLTAILTLGDPDIYDGLLPVPGCPGDFNNVNGLNVADIFAFLTAWFAQGGQAGPGLSADFNEDNVVNVADIFAFLAAWFTGC